MKKVIIPTGYMGSGSSAVTDLLREYPRINTKNADFEFIFLHAPNGVFDLENKLLFNNNAIRSDEALKTFKSFMESLYDYRGWWPAGYRQTVSPNIEHIVEEYIASLTTAQFTGAWYYYENPTFVAWLLNVVRNRVRRLLHRKMRKIRPKQQDLLFSIITPDEFYDKTRVFINNIINEFAQEEFVVMDQLLLPFNLKTMENYKIDNLYPIIVTRDPRDVFIANKYYWYPDNYQVPYPLDAHDFCKYYKSIRENEGKFTLRALRVNFEDLVLNYDATIKEIEEYIGISEEEHQLKFEFLNPEVSINNIQIFNRNEEYQKEVAIIEEELADYLYPFESEIISTGEIF